MSKETSPYDKTARNKRNLLPSLFPKETFSFSNYKDAKDNFGYGNVFDRITRFLALRSLQETIDEGLFISPTKLNSIFFCLDVPTDTKSIENFLGKKYKERLDGFYHRTFLDGTVLWEAQLASNRVIQGLEKETQTVTDDVVEDLLIDIRADSKRLLETGQMTTNQASRELKNNGFSPLIRTTGSNIFKDVLGAELTPRQILKLCQCSPLPLERLLPMSQHDFSKIEEFAIFYDENKSENLQEQLVSNGLRMGHIPFIIDRPLTDSEMVNNIIGQFKKITGCQDIDEFKIKFKKQLSKREYYIPFAELLFKPDSVFIGEKEMGD